jgi:hypothetical protein
MIDYKKTYNNVFRKLPKILAITIAVLVFIWSIVDVSVFSSVSRYYGSHYGVLGLGSWPLALIIWWAIGAVVSFATWFFTAVGISATVVRTDAIVEINEKLANRE